MFLRIIPNVLYAETYFAWLDFRLVNPFSEHKSTKNIGKMPKNRYTF